jgi:uncharacterized membrane protein
VENSPERLTALSDAVFAFAITLLAIDLRLPPGTTAANLGSQLASLRPHYFAFGLSFVVVGAYWAAHRRIFRHVRQLDDRLIWLNILLLATIAFVPFPTSVVAEFGDTPEAVILYAATALVIGCVLTGLWLYTVSQPELATEEGRTALRSYAVRSLAAPLVFAVSIPVALVSPAVAVDLWIASGILYFGYDIFLNRTERRRRGEG